MKWVHALARKFPHKYAIDATLLGDDRCLAWTNLGYWENTAHYPTACMQLADQLAQAIHLNAQDCLLDLGCGAGASLQHWQQHYGVKNISAVELQASKIIYIQKNVQDLEHLVHGSFLNLTDDHLQQHFDVAVCIDAAYHSPLPLFLTAVSRVLKNQGRVGFHYLMLSPKWHECTALQKQKYYYLLKAADVNLKNIYDETTTRQILSDADFTDIEIKDISKQVFAGFAHYIHTQNGLKQKSIANLKIQATAKLCQYLYEEQMICYVQMSATKK